MRVPKTMQHMLRVGVNGYGTIGKRVADAVAAQPDMTLLGVAKRSPDYTAERAHALGYNLYPPAEYEEQFETRGLTTAGTLRELVMDSDVIVDATPSGIGAENYPLYVEHETPAVFQGGEEDSLVEASFNARGNFEQARGVDYTRVVSCNTTGLSRLLAPLAETYGIEKARVTLIRRGGDPDQSNRGPINDILPDPISIPSHHGPDVQTIFPELAIDTLGTKAPTTLMHLHAVNVTLEEQVEAETVQNLLQEESRLFVIPRGIGIDGTGTLTDVAEDAGRPRGDIWENNIWAESITTTGRDLYLFQAIDQRADVVPENIDALRAMFDLVEEPHQSIQMTNQALGMGIGTGTGPGPRYGNE